MRQRLVIAGLIICAVVVAAVFLVRAGVSNVIGSGQAFTEKSAVSTLRSLHWAQGNLRKGGNIDEDGDRIGEFGTMEQLAALAPLPSGDLLAAALVPMAGTKIESGILMAGGYCYRFDLPEGVEARERRFHAIAWPMAAAAGQKAFCINQDDDILESPNAENFIGCDRAPPPGTCPGPDAPGSAWTRWRGKTSQLRVGYVD